MRSLDLTEAVNETYNHDCMDKQIVLDRTRKIMDEEGYLLSSMRMNDFGEVTVNLWRPLQEGEEVRSYYPVDKETGDRVKVEFLRFFAE